MSANEVALSRVLAAMAWSGGRLEEKDKTSLRGLFADLGLSSEERAQVEPLLDNPVTLDQFGALTREFRAAIPSAEERKRLLEFARERIQARSDLAVDEALHLDLLRLWIDDENTARDNVAPPSAEQAAAPGRVHGLLGGLRRRAAAVTAGGVLGPVATGLIEALRGKVGHQAAGGFLPAGRRHFVTLYGALLYRVIRADNVVRPEETDRLRLLLQEGFGFSGAEIEPVVAMIESEVAANADRQHLCAEFNRITEMDQRLGLLEALFAVALADGEISSEEEMEVRLIANYLWIETQEYVRVRREAVGTNSASGGRS